MDMLKAILDIEKKAQNIVDTFDSLTQEENEKTQNQLSELEEKADEEIKLQTAELEAKCEEELKSELKENAKVMQDKTDAMEKNFSENRERWVKEITHRIIGGDEK